MMRSMLRPPNPLQENDVEEPEMESLAKKLRIVALELKVLNDESAEI